MTSAVFYGVFMTSAVQGLLGGVGWWMVGLPSPLTAGFTMFFFSLLPTGTVLVWGPGAVYLLIQGHPFKAAILALWGIAIVGAIDNFLRPFFISGRTHMHSLLVFFGVLGGLAAYGIGGLFLGPLLITLFLFLVQVIRRDSARSDASPATRGSVG
jgi:predicted PurR-regulated permease PerM